METNKVKVISEFEVEDKKYKLVYPSVNVIREANFKHRKAFTDALKNGFYTKKKLEIILQEGDINVIQNHINRRAEILKQYYDASVLVEKAETSEQLDYLAEILKTYKDSFIQEDMSMNSLFSNTAEQLSEDERINFLCFSLMRNEDNTLIWKNYEDYLTDNDFTFIERCKYEVLRWDYSLGKEDDENQPEVKALKRADSMRESAKELEEQEQLTTVTEEVKELPINIKKGKGKPKKAQSKEKSAKKIQRRAVTDGANVS